MTPRPPPYFIHLVPVVQIGERMTECGLSDPKLKIVDNAHANLATCDLCVAVRRSQRSIIPPDWPAR